MQRPPLYYFFCNHGTQGGIGFAFPLGYCEGKKFNRNFYAGYNIYKMLEAADEFPGLKVSMELDSYAYEAVAEEDPECIARLREYIRAGKASVAGGTYGQPLGQDYGWEPNVRQLTYGRRVIQELLDYDVETFLVEEQWFHPQLPQLLQGAGFRYASLQNQNSGQVKPMNKVMINWVGIDGTRIPAVPANDLLVSCVRQYTDYSAFASKLAQYEHPLLFQWVELWVPGMDWGASATPFRKAIEQIKEWGGRSVSLGEFFATELPHRQLEDVYIPLDESNYHNNWYQGGGWGYDGDRVIMEDKRAEAALLAAETVMALTAAADLPYPQMQLEQWWKKLMILQNHDFSVARNYRAVTAEGLVTEAGSLAVVEYNHLRQECLGQIHERLGRPDGGPGGKIGLLNTTGIGGEAAVPVEVSTSISPERLVLRQNGRCIPCQFNSSPDGKVSGTAVVDLPAVGVAALEIEEADATRAASQGDRPAVDSKNCAIEDENFRIWWEPGTWAVNVEDKARGQRLQFKGFCGPISKQNEHNFLYPALSPAHEKFSFAFDGQVHSPDQITDVRAQVTEWGPVQSTILLRSDLLTLHTTSTPAAFAEARVTLNHITGQVECESYLYTGIYLGLNCHAEFTHNIAGGKYYRDFPFGEEETQIEAIYPNTYIRVDGSEGGGFTLVHPGVQRAFIKRDSDGGTIRHLLARDRVFGEYRWKFRLYFGDHTPSDSARLAKRSHGCFVQVQGDTVLAGQFLHIEHPDLMPSAIFRENGSLFIRLVNYSPSPVEGAVVTLGLPAARGQRTDLLGNPRGELTVQPKAAGDREETEILLPRLSPWEIITIKLD